MKDFTDVAWMWLGLPDDAVAYSLSYRQSGLTELYVTGAVEMAQVEAEHAKSRLQARQCSALARFIRSLDKPPRQGPKSWVLGGVLRDLML